MPREFEVEVQRIVKDNAVVELADITSPASYGWLRRQEYDRDGVQVWERPDGSLRGVPIGDKPTRPR